MISRLRQLPLGDTVALTCSTALARLKSIDIADSAASPAGAFAMAIDSTNWPQGQYFFDATPGVGRILCMCPIATDAGYPRIAGTRMPTPEKQY